MPEENSIINPSAAGSRPVVAITGRYNVGKSTLLNRLTGKRMAIVSDMPGTTRDRIISTVTWQDKEFTIVDTGGLIAEPSSSIDEGVNLQVKEAISEADLVLFLVSTADGLIPSDLEIADWLRKTGKKFLLVANKADNPKRETIAVDFYSLGMGEPVIISAYHDLGIDDLLDRIVSLIPEGPPAEDSRDDILKIALVGRPNVGKSMLLNKLLGEDRVIVSQVPGTTRDAIDTLLNFDGDPVVLIDTAGVKRRGRVGKGVDKYSVIRSLRAIDRADVALLLLDATEPATAQDTHIASFIQEAGKGVIIVVNKWDLISHTEQSEYNLLVGERFKFMPYAKIMYTSAKTGRGVNKLVPEARKIREERKKRITTGELNGFISRVVAGQAPPRKGSKTLKVFYVTQAEVEPPTFVFFVNDASLVHFSYQRYIENRLRENYGFEGTPIKMVFKNRGES
ncbi:MAG: ribosome biogenesis GTPase Der [Dehalococcoidales bacterium]|nr:ribosome biogenesis GTPase Der [Dehalococcoidales bacterium]MDD4230304.1 ribosome biogenesis GTPase Der [Dehalococcoidales bacterium]MDD4465363.1 ribosome biogenesis GTPase Der [Dehalococcoidales bacterium]MDD5402045.1 ribosome biogenesis GTPase Der [Dehalococcoidales bacterium]